MKEKIIVTLVHTISIVDYPRNQISRPMTNPCHLLNRHASNNTLFSGYIDT